MKSFKITSDDIPGAKAAPNADCYLPATDPMYTMAYPDGGKMELGCFKEEAPEAPLINKQEPKQDLFERKEGS